MAHSALAVTLLRSRSLIVTREGFSWRISSASFGWPTLITVIVAYELATIGTMVVMVTIAHASARTLRAPWLDRYGDAIAGGVIVFVGAMVSLLGI